MSEETLKKILLTTGYTQQIDKEAVYDYIQELNKELEEYKLITIDYQELEVRNKDLENQQKEFIEYINKTIKELECDDVDDEEMKGYLIQRIDTFKEILSKYKEIVGSDK